MSQQGSPGLPAPQDGQAFMNVSALDAGILAFSLRSIIAGADPGESITCPSLAFLLQHSRLGTRVVFDLGIRRDIEAYPPAVLRDVGRYEEGKVGCQVLPCPTVDESLIKGGISPDQIELVVISHLHWDHVGDSRPFTNATFVVGEECKSILTPGYPADPNSLFADDCIPVERTRFLSAADFATSIGPFPHAMDYFGDGSMYIIDMPGHLPGHVNVLARTSLDGAWILLGGDSAHHFRLITGQAKVEYRVNEMGVVHCAHANKAVAEESIGRIGKLLGIPRVQVLISHDADWYNANKGGSIFLPGTIPALQVPHEYTW